MTNMHASDTTHTPTDGESPAGAVTLSKCSVPGWDKDFDSMAEAVDELRKHICDMCFEGEFPGDEPIDRECRDPNTLLGTPCGLEFEIDPWPARGDD